MFIKRTKNKKGKIIQFESNEINNNSNNSKEEKTEKNTFLNKKHTFPYSTENPENRFSKVFIDNLKINQNNSPKNKEGKKEYKIEKISLDEKPKIIQEKGVEEKMKVPFFFKVNCIFDYAPGICKDFKETGYCGFGETCIFVHDRGDYKLGWEMERDWQKMQKIREKKKMEKFKKKKLENENIHLSDISSSSSSDCDCHSEKEKLNTICKICNNEISNAVIVNCGHIFCEKCVVGHFKENKKKCIVCGENLNGIFNNANKIIEHMKKKNGEKKNDNNKRKFVLIGKEENYNNDYNVKESEIDFGNIGKNLKEGEEVICNLYDNKDNDKKDYFDYLDKNRNNNLDNLLDNLNEDCIKFTKEKKLKNKIKQQNDWLYKSNYSKY